MFLENLTWSTEFPKIFAILYCICINLRGGGTVRPPPPLALVFCPLLKLSLRNPYLKILDLAKLFVAIYSWKINPKFLFYPLSEQFEIWIWKPPMGERVKIRYFRGILDPFVQTRTEFGSNPNARIRICNPGFQVDREQRLCAADHRWSRQLVRNQSISEERKRGF